MTTPLERVVYDALSRAYGETAGGLGLSGVAAATGLDAEAVLWAINKLEAKGKVTRVLVDWGAFDIMPLRVVFHARKSKVAVDSRPRKTGESA